MSILVGVFFMSSTKLQRMDFEVTHTQLLSWAGQDRMPFEETSAMWLCIWVLVICNVGVLLHNLWKIYQRRILQGRLQMELSNASGEIVLEDAFSTMASFAPAFTQTLLSTNYYFKSVETKMNHVHCREELRAARHTRHLWRIRLLYSW